VLLWEHTHRLRQHCDYCSDLILHLVFQQAATVYHPAVMSSYYSSPNVFQSQVRVVACRSIDDVLQTGAKPAIFIGQMS